MIRCAYFPAKESYAKNRLFIPATVDIKPADYSIYDTNLRSCSLPISRKSDIILSNSLGLIVFCPAHLCFLCGDALKYVFSNR